MERHSSCRSTLPLIQYIEKHGKDPEDLVRGLPVTLNYLRNTRNWISRDLFVDLFDRCETLFNDPLIMYKIGQEGWTSQQGSLAAFVNLLLTPSVFINLSPRIISFHSKFYELITDRLDSNEARFSFHWQSRDMAHRHGCTFNAGWVVGLPRNIWQTKARITEDECVLSGEMDSIKAVGEPPPFLGNTRFNARRCSYRLQWAEPKYADILKPFFKRKEEHLRQALTALEEKELKLQEIEAAIERSANQHQEIFNKAMLSQREKEVAECVLDGLSNTTIAERLFISVETVKKHLNNIYHKIGVKSRTELATKFIRD